MNQFVSLGDVVNYGPWSNECVDLLETLPAIRLIGNHEENFLAGNYPGENDLVKTFFNVTAPEFARKEQIMKYAKEFKTGNYLCTHTIMGAYVYPDTPIEITGNYFIGHSHYQFNRHGSGYHVVNVGSVGQNRREINVINYALFDPESGHITLRDLVYDIGEVIQKMKDMKYPQVCIDYYKNKPHRR